LPLTVPQDESDGQEMQEDGRRETAPVGGAGDARDAADRQGTGAAGREEEQETRPEARVIASGGRSGIDDATAGER